MENIQSTETKQSITSEWLIENTEIRLCLKIMLCMMAAIGLFLTIVPICQFDSQRIIYSVSDILQGFISMGLSAYTIKAFRKRQPNAVMYARVYFAMIVVFYLSLLFLTEPDGKSILLDTKMQIGSIVNALFWLVFLYVSKNVKEVIPLSFRNYNSRDIYIILAAILLPVSSYLTGEINGLIKEGMKEYAQQQFVESVSEGERTDGDIIFKLPEDFTCDSVQVKNEAGETFVIFKLENTRTGLHSMLYGDQSNDFTIALFEHCWSEHFDPGYAYEDVDDGEMTINDHNCFFRRIKYLVGDTYVYWDLFVLCDPDNGKYALFQTYEDGEDIAYITPLLESIRFK